MKVHYNNYHKCRIGNGDGNFKLCEPPSVYIRETHFSDTDDDDKSDYSSICGVPKVERNKSVIPDNHPHSFLHPGFYSYLKRIKFRVYNIHINITGNSDFDLLCL